MKNKFSGVHKVGTIPAYTPVKIEAETSSGLIKETVLSSLGRVGESDPEIQNTSYKISPLKPKRMTVNVLFSRET